VEQASADGDGLVGRGGLLAGLTKQVIEAGLGSRWTSASATKFAAAGRNHGDSRNGARSKTVVTEIGPVAIEVARDRESAPATLVNRARLVPTGCTRGVCNASIAGDFIGRGGHRCALRGGDHCLGVTGRG
jgi:transposase-like protein